jgi:hypothetical protein
VSYNKKVLFRCFYSLKSIKIEIHKIPTTKITAHCCQREMVLVSTIGFYAYEWINGLHKLDWKRLLADLNLVLLVIRAWFIVLSLTVGLNLILVRENSLNLQKGDDIQFDHQTIKCTKFVKTARTWKFWKNKLFTKIQIH